MIIFKNLPQQEHADLLDDLEKMAEIGYDAIIEAMIADLLKVLKKEKLIKSDKLVRGWTGKVEKIELDLSSSFDKVLDKYLKALKYLLLGKMAGTEATKAAKGVDFGDTIPGIIINAYLDSLDTQLEYGEKVTGKEQKPIQKELVKETVEQITNKTSRFIDESMGKLQNRILSAIEMEVERVNNSNIEATISGDNTNDKIKKSPLERAIREVGETHRTDWKRMVNANVTVASAVGTHQSVQEVYAKDDDDIRVAWVALRDEKTCIFCKNASRNADGSFKLYRMGDFEPAGYNYGKKRDQWRLCIPGAHPNCRCTLVYVPKGFAIDNTGAVAPKKK